MTTNQQQKRQQAERTITSADALTAIVRGGESLSPAMVEACAKPFPPTAWTNIREAAEAVLYRAGYDTDASEQGSNVGKSNASNRWTRLLDTIEEMHAEECQDPACAIASMPGECQTHSPPGA